MSLEIKKLFSHKFTVAAIKKDNTCPVEEFLLMDDPATLSYRENLLYKLEMVAKNGIDNVPAKWSHEASKRDGIYEFIQGPFRVFYFKGKDGHIAVCTCVVRKDGNKADRASVKLAANYKKQYHDALDRDELVVESDDED